MSELASGSETVSISHCQAVILNGKNDVTEPEKQNC